MKFSAGQQLDSERLLKKGFNSVDVWERMKSQSSLFTYKNLKKEKGSNYISGNKSKERLVVERKREGGREKELYLYVLPGLLLIHQIRQEVIFTYRS